MKKYEKLITIKQASSMLGLTKGTFYGWLRARKIMLKTNNYNLPYDYYLRNGWFKVFSVDIKNEHFDSIVPKVRITKKGFLGLKGKIQQDKNNFFLKFDRALLETVRYCKISRADKILSKPNGDEIAYHKNKIILFGNFIKGDIWTNIN